MSMVKDMWEGNVSPEVKEHGDKLKEFMADKGNHMCQRCGAEMQLTEGCTRCGKCGFTDCGGE